MSLNSATSRVALATSPLLHTKQHPPQAHRDWVARPRLLQLLNTGLTHPVMVVSVRWFRKDYPPCPVVVRERSPSGMDVAGCT